MKRPGIDPQGGCAFRCAFGANAEGDEIDMARNVNEAIKKLSAAQRKQVAARAAVLIAEEMTLQELRKARKMTQDRMAKDLGIAQKQISAIEKRTDMHISTLRRAIEAMGGSLALVAQFPDREPVKLAGIAAIGAVPLRRSVSRRRSLGTRA
jgi:DNA-binding XRE family transcriptional regulator